jgi:hypothetical protein
MTTGASSCKAVHALETITGRGASVTSFLPQPVLAENSAFHLAPGTNKPRGLPDPDIAVKMRKPSALRPDNENGCARKAKTAARNGRFLEILH